LAIAALQARGYNACCGQEADADSSWRSEPSGRAVVTRKQWTVTAIIGVAAVCLSFLAGSGVAMYATATWPAFPPVSWLQNPIPRLGSPTPAQAVFPSPSAADTLVPSPTARAPSPTPTSTWVVPTLPSTIFAPREPASPDEGEPDDTPAEARPIEPGATQSHNLHVPADQDWLYFEAEAGTSYEVWTSNLGREIDTVATLYDSEGRQLAFDDEGGEEFRSSRLFWVSEDGERLYLMVRGFADAEGGWGTEYEISLRVAEVFRMDEYEPDDTQDQATRIEPGESQRHNRHVSADEDWVVFRAEAGQTYVIETSRLGALADTVIYLYDAQGIELAVDDDGGEEERASRLEWTAPNGGRFFVKVENWLPTLAGPGTGYDLTLKIQQGDQGPEPQPSPGA